MRHSFAIRVWALALGLLPMLCFLGPAEAAPRKQPPTISAFEMEPVDRLATGAEMFFRLQGTPGARATVRVAGVNRTIIL